MALQQFACGLTVIVIFLCKGCHSQPNAPTCGMVKGIARIVGGENADPGSWPWQAYLTIDGSVCGGSLINNQWVMTAAHCITSVQMNQTVVYLGRYNQSGTNPNEMIRTLDAVISHPNYSSSTLENDICLLKLSSPVTFTDYIQPVCLAAEGSVFHSGVSSWTTGFGTTDSGLLAEILQQVNVPIVGNRECNCYYDGFITENMICAGLTEGGKDSCQGDSGGPLVFNVGSNWLQTGITSFGFGCGRPMFPGVYARVSQYQNWIISVVDGMDVGFITYFSSGIDSDEFFICSAPTSPPYSSSYVVTTDDSIFNSAENLIRLSHFFSLSAVGLSLHLLAGGGAI